MIQGLDKIANTPPSFLLQAEILGFKIGFAILLVGFFALAAQAVYNYGKKGFWKGFFGIDPRDKNVGKKLADIAALVFIAVVSLAGFGFLGWLVEYSQYSILFGPAGNYIFIFSTIVILISLFSAIVLMWRFFKKVSFGGKTVVCLTLFFGFLLALLFILSFFILLHLVKYFQ